MACASCGGGRQLSPNRPSSMPSQGQQSQQRIVVSPKSGGPGNKQVFKPNEPKTKRTQV